MKLGARGPNLFETQIANVATAETVGGKRRTAFHRSVRLQSQHSMAGAAAGPVNAFIAEPAPHVLVRPEVPDIVAHHHQQPALDTCLIQAREQRHQFGKPIRLQEQMFVVGGISHGHGELDLPVRGPLPSHFSWCERTMGTTG
jgi:hypothetical protein